MKKFFELILKSLKCIVDLISSKKKKQTGTVADLSGIIKGANIEDYKEYKYRKFCN